MKTYQIDQKRIEELRNSLTSHPLTPEQQIRCEKLRETYKTLAFMILSMTPPSREQSVAITTLEASLMWATKAIACNENE